MQTPLFFCKYVFQTEKCDIIINSTNFNGICFAVQLLAAIISTGTWRRGLHIWHLSLLNLLNFKYTYIYKAHVHKYKVINVYEAYASI